jgi:hypothetical protein
MTKRRVWFWWYHDTGWTGWRKFFLPWIGNDEYGRLTLVVPIHPAGWVIIAYRTCYCDDCAAIREQTARYEGEADAAVH